VDPKLTHSMTDEEKNVKNMGCFFDNEDDKVHQRHRLRCGKRVQVFFQTVNT
jgi:hypothetical protein